jgi:predicted DNA-binding transcriptional regulator AlpA
MRWRPLFFETCFELLTMNDQVPDSLVPSPQVQREFNVSVMTIWRWDKNKNLGFPPAIKINGRNYRSRQQLEAFKQRLLARALKTR